ncbi:hypothetical protein CWIS_06020 [Cellulomonas sp. A375-1]|uniref:pentapeptide repeat-containing protein n=1 Tax=Cellulomonas sp. A375-1 TaxID=1672219 RepID=UPI0006527B2B|nr:pentapeptide repeat-containing protein [Cellulomonas sp. A375-1]KMM46287.1 hypothetical protein CWIS_06020 [Cellulomonas sp. A375-1]
MLLEPGGDYDGLTLRGERFDGQDASEARFLDCAFEQCTLDDTDLSHARLVDTSWAGVRSATLRIAGSAWQDGTLHDCRLGAVQAYAVRWTRVHVVGGKVDYLNLRDSTLEHVRFTGVVIDELDLARVRATHLTFEDCRVRRLDVTGATLKEADVRGIRDLQHLDGVAGLAGATVSTEQLVELAPALAEHLGLRVR